MHPDNKYQLSNLHREIDLFDRKIAHARNIEHFASEHSRQLAVKKLETRRGPLAAAAMELAKQGVEHDPASLPRSFKAALADPATKETA